MFSGNLAPASPAVASFHGTTIGNFFFASPSLIQTYGFYAGNLQVLSPSLIKASGVGTLSMYLISPAFILDGEAIDAFNLKEVDPVLIAVTGIKAYNLQQTSPAVLEYNGIGPVQGLPRETWLVKRAEEREEERHCRLIADASGSSALVRRSENPPGPILSASGRSAVAKN